MSNYDTIATPVMNNNPFKAAVIDSNLTTSQLEDSESKRIAKSKVLLRAAKSITKTKSVSGSFIVKTTVHKTPVKAKTKFDQDYSDNKSPIPHQRGDDAYQDSINQLSPITDKNSAEKSFIAMKMSLNPLIKNTFASPDKSRVNNIDMSYIDQKANDQPPSSVNRFSFSAIKPKKSTTIMKSKIDTVP